MRQTKSVPSMPSIKRLLFLTAGMLLPHYAISAGLCGQVVNGQVVDSISGTPVGTGFVILLDDVGNEATRALTTSDGRFSLESAAAGTYRLRSERIGYRASVSEPFEIGAGETLSHTLHVVAIPIVLAEVVVSGEDRCHVSPDSAEETGVVWEEIRKALAATAWDGTQELVRYRLYSYERELDAEGEIRGERGRTLEGVAGQPYASLPATDLARDGYVVVSRDGEVSFALPDAQVLMSDSFLEDHCFHVIRDGGNRPGEVGLAFEPIAEHGRTEVGGALWLAESTSELKTLEVRYTALPEGIEDQRVGGTVDFLRLPSGAWIVQQWQVRTPVLLSYRPQVRVRGRGARPRATVSGYRDLGGEVLEIDTRDGGKLYPAALAHLTGSVFDSTRNTPLAHATVSIVGTGFSARSDSTGAYHLTAPLEGEYVVALSHPWLDSLAYLVEHPVPLTRERTLGVSFRIPHVETILGQICPAATANADVGTVVGVVTEQDSTEVIAEAEITASWQIIEVQGDRLAPRTVETVVTSEASGLYVLCGIPVGHPVRIRAARGRVQSAEASLILPRSDAGTLLLDWNRDPAEGYRQSFPLERAIWKLDLGLTDSERGAASASPPSTLSGQVTDRTTGLPVNGVTVGVNGGQQAVSRADGTFDLLDAGWLEGMNVVAIGRMGYQPWAQEIWVDEQDAHVDLSVKLEPAALTLDPVGVTASAIHDYLTKVGFYHRERVNFGYFMDREEIEEKLGRSANVIELLTAVPGVEVGDPTAGSLGSTMSFERGQFSVGACPGPRVFVDGFLVNTDPHQSRLSAPQNTALFEVVRPEDVYAMEVYRTPSQVPPQYGGAESACGVLLIWTRRGR